MRPDLDQRELLTWAARIQIPGTYDIDVSTFEGLETGSYTLSVTP